MQEITTAQVGDSLYLRAKAFRTLFCIISMLLSAVISRLLGLPEGGVAPSEDPGASAEHEGVTEGGVNV